MSDDAPSIARRPTPEDVPDIMEAIGLGKSLRKACAEAGIHPGHMIGLLQGDDRLWAQYARARALRGDDQGHRISEIVEDVISGGIAPDAARAAIDGLKWTAGRMSPKLWGDKQRVEHTGEGGGPIQYANLTPEERRARIAELQEKARGPDDGGGA